MIGVPATVAWKIVDSGPDPTISSPAELAGTTTLPVNTPGPISMRAATVSSLASVMASWMLHSGEPAQSGLETQYVFADAAAGTRAAAAVVARTIVRRLGMGADSRGDRAVQRCAIRPFLAENRTPSRPRAGQDGHVP